MAEGSVIFLVPKERFAAKHLHALASAKAARNPLAKLAPVGSEVEGSKFAGKAFVASVGARFTRPREIAHPVRSWRTRRFATENEPNGGNPFDPEELALELCRELAELGQERDGWIEIESLVSRTRFPEEVVVA